MASSSASSSIRRLPFREAVESLRQGGPGSIVLSQRVSSITLKFVAKNSEPGPRQFLRDYAPRLSYSNPSLPIKIERIPDPRSKSKDPKNKDRDAFWEGGVQPKPEMTIEFRGSPSQTIPLTHLDGGKIFEQLVAVAGEDVPSSIGAPSASI